MIFNPGVTALSVSGQPSDLRRNRHLDLVRPRSSRGSQQPVRQIPISFSEDLQLRRIAGLQAARYW